MATKTNSFNIPALFQQVFGVKGVRFAIPPVGNIANTAVKVATFAAGQIANEALNAGVNTPQLYQGVQTLPAPTAASIKSVLGTPIYEQLTLSIPATVSNGVVTSPAFTYTFPDWPMFDISPQWLIEKENTQGGIGSTKEFIQEDDSIITIRGFLINYASDDYPEQLLADFWKAINSKKSMGITGRVFNLLGIHNLVVTNARLVGVEGYMNIQPFEIDCLSDYTPILVIKSVKTQRPITPGL